MKIDLTAPEMQFLIDSIDEYIENFETAGRNAPQVIKAQHEATLNKYEQFRLKVTAALSTAIINDAQ